MPKDFKKYYIKRSEPTNKKEEIDFKILDKIAHFYETRSNDIAFTYVSRRYGKLNSEPLRHVFPNYNFYYLELQNAAKPGKQASIAGGLGFRVGIKQEEGKISLYGVPKNIIINSICLGFDEIIESENVKIENLKDAENILGAHYYLTSRPTYIDGYKNLINRKISDVKWELGVHPENDKENFYIVTLDKDHRIIDWKNSNYKYPKIRENVYNKFMEDF